MSVFEKKYRFTSSRHSKKGMMALIFGMISLISLFLAVALTIRDAEGIGERMGGSGFFAFVFGMAGLLLGLAAMQENDVFQVMPRTGFSIALAAVLLWIGVVCAGIFGIG